MQNVPLQNAQIQLVTGCNIKRYDLKMRRVRTFSKNLKKCLDIVEHVSFSSFEKIIV